jgi:hypothetical protein
MHAGMDNLGKNKRDRLANAGQGKRVDSHRSSIMINISERPNLIEDSIYDIPLRLEASLEPQRGSLQRTLVAAQKRLREFALKHNWHAHVQEPFALKARIYDTKAKFDHDLLEVSGMDTNIELPRTYCAALEKDILVCVSPERYQKVYPEGDEEDAFEKLVTHEMAHRLHIRILKGDDEAMGPVWFYEGFALYAADQFKRTMPALSENEIWEVVSSEERGDYRQYATVFRHFLSKVSIHQLVENAGRQGFTKWLMLISKK